MKDAQDIVLQTLCVCVKMSSFSCSLAAVCYNGGTLQVVQEEQIVTIATCQSNMILLLQKNSLHHQTRPSSSKLQNSDKMQE